MSSYTTIDSIPGGIPVLYVNSLHLRAAGSQQPVAVGANGTQIDPQSWARWRCASIPALMTFSCCVESPGRLPAEG